MVDDWPVDDDTRTALRGLAQRAEWGTDPGEAEAEANAGRMRELGRALAARAAGDQDRTTWGYHAAVALAEHCRSATATWSVADIAQLARLRAAAVTALAAGPGQQDQSPPQADRARQRPALSLPRGRRAAITGLIVVACAALAAIAIVGTSASHGASPTATAATASAQPPTGFAGTATQAATATGATGTGTGAAVGTGTAPTASSASSSAPAASTSHITAIQMTATAASGYPEVQIYGTITASGKGDVTYTVTIAGPSGASPQASTEDESGQTSYALSRTLYLQPWCGQKSVTVTVSSGTVSSSTTVPVSGC